MVTEIIKQKAQEKTAQWIAFRRDLHRHPEVSMEEHRTAQILAKELAKLDGMEVIENLAGGTGVAGILHGKKGEGKTVLLRADIDALPIEETTGLPFASEEKNAMHACGHDGHTTWLLGSAQILSEMREYFSGTIKFVFQPGEEGGGGGRKMVQEDRILENPKVDAVFAAHAWPEVESGKVSIATRSAFGYPGSFSIQVTGKGGHGSWPHQCIDPIAVANQIYGALQQIVSRRLPETTARVISVCTIHSGPQDKSNVIPDCCTMTGTIRADKKEVMEQIVEDIQKISQGIAQANGAQAEVTARYSGAVINHPDAVAHCVKSVGKIVGENQVYLDQEPHLGGEDFSEYISRVPGAYLFAGIAKNGLENTPGLHSSNFLLDEDVIPTMAAAFSQIAIDFLENNGFQD